MIERSWRVLLEKHIKSSSLQDVYEFGVFTGKSMVEIADIYRRLGIPLRKFFGLDSFEGLPEDPIEPAWQECWEEGNFDSRQHFGVNTADQCINVVASMVSPHMPLNSSLQLIKGFYENTLNDLAVVKYDMQPASYIDIDVDIYSSAVFVLDFMFKNNLIKSGTIIGYDDWGGSPGWQSFANGESRAHKEIINKYGATCTLLGQWGSDYPHIARLYRVD